MAEAEAPMEVEAESDVVSEISSDSREGPVLYLCSNCNLPLAESGDCVGRVENDNIVILKAVTENVEIHEEKAVSTYERDFFSTVQTLYCKGCTVCIGALYLSTPIHLDYKRDLFTLNTTVVTCYYVDNPHKQRSEEKSVILPNVAYMETQITKCRSVFAVCESMVSEMKNKLQLSYESS